MFQHVTVLFEQQAEELPRVMGHDVHLQPSPTTDYVSSKAVASKLPSGGRLSFILGFGLASQPLDNARDLRRFIADLKADDLFQRQHMRAAQVKVRVRRRKSV